MTRTYILDDSSVQALREIAEALSSGDSIAGRRVELSDRLLLAIGRADATTQEATAEAAKQTGAISSEDHARLPSDERRWHMDSENCGALSILGCQLLLACQLDRTPLTTAFRRASSKSILHAIESCDLMTAQQADLASQLVCDVIRRQRERGG